MTAVGGRRSAVGGLPSAVGGSAVRVLMLLAGTCGGSLVGWNSRSPRRARRITIANDGEQPQPRFARPAAAVAAAFWFLD